MFLTTTDFNKIRRINWKLQTIADKTYYTAVNEIDTYLFWFDFMRFIFAPKFKNQQGVSYIANFDTTQPVLLTTEFELKLPVLIESAIYYAENQNTKAPFSFAVSKNIILVVAQIALLICILWNYMRHHRRLTTNGSGSSSSSGRGGVGGTDGSIEYRNKNYDDDAPLM